MILQLHVANGKGLHRRPGKNAFLILVLVQVKRRQDKSEVLLGQCTSYELTCKLNALVNLTLN